MGYYNLGNLYYNSLLLRMLVPSVSAVFRCSFRRFAIRRDPRSFILKGTKGVPGKGFEHRST